MEKPYVSQPQERIRRLDQAIGDTNAASFNRTEHLAFVLEAIGDKAALALLRKAA